MTPPLTSQAGTARPTAGFNRSAGMTLLFLLLASLPVMAQTIYFRVPQVRVTVPLLSTNTTVVTNSINLSGVTNATFSISGLPAGAGAYLTDTNGAVITSVNGDTNLWLIVNTTNIAHGIYTYTLNAGGSDTNGLPATNYIRLVLQAAHIWNGSGGLLGNSNAWSTAASWRGGVPAAGSDVVFTDIDAQTNVFDTGFAFTNSYVDANFTIGSVRFSQTGDTNSIATNSDLRPRSHSLFINAGRTLTLAGTNGFSLLRDYVDDFQGLGTMNVNIFGGAGSRLVVSNANANFAMVIGNSALTTHPTLNASNLDSSVTFVNRLGLGEYQLFPNYRHYNDSNNYAARPSRFCMNFHMPRTNIVTAIYKDADNYTNEFTRGYAMTFLDSEVFGVGSGIDSFLQLGQSNAFFLDSVCFVRANQSSGNNGFVRFNPAFTNGTAIFRSTNNARMSLFAVSDDGGPGFGEGNVKANIDFASGNGFVDILTDRLIIARDRSIVASNHTVNVTGTLTLGRGTTDVNTVNIGFQEASSKTNWFAIDPLPADNAYLGFCQGTLVITNGGVFRVNRTLTLGYTADTNDVTAAHQWETSGQVSVFSNSVMMVSNIVCDTGLNYYDANKRNNRLTINQGTLIVSNTIGGAPGLPLDRLSMNNGTIVLAVKAGQTNGFVRDFVNSGSLPSIVKVASLTGVTIYPTNIPLFSYETAQPFMAADMSAIPGGVQGYIINNTDNQTIDLFVTTNAPKNLVWRGNVDNVWNLTTKNWGLVTGGPDTNFSMGDIATFNDSSSVTNIDLTTLVVPSQASGVNGVTVTNVTRNYIINAVGGAIAGTAQIVKQGTGNLTFNAPEAGPFTVQNGSVDGFGNLGSTVIWSNGVFNFAGTVTGGLTSTGRVTIASGGSVLSGTVNIRGGGLTNYGLINASSSMSVNGGSFVTNAAGAEIDVDTGATGGNWLVSGGSTIANEGLIKMIRGRINVAPTGAPFDGATIYGTGTFKDADGGLGGVGAIPAGSDGRFAINPSALISPGPTLYNSIGTLHADARIDLNNTPASGLGVLRIEVDFNDAQVNDILACDRWNNITGMLLMTNINPGAGSFALGQSFTIFQNNNGPTFPNFIDVNGTYPTISPTLPAPGLQWGLSDFRSFGTLTVTNAGLVWNGTSGTWDTNNAGNLTWKGSKFYEDNQGAMFDDSASGTTTIGLNVVVAPTGFDVTTNITAGVTNLFTNTPCMSPGIIFSNTAKDYLITGNGKISGITGMYKTGNGTLTILTTNDFAGNATLVAGTVAVTNVNGFGGPPPSGARPNETFFEGGTLRYIGLANASWPRVWVMNGTAAIDVASATNELTSSTILGLGAVVKTGPGTLVVNSVNTYSGGTTVSNGTLRINNANGTSTNSTTLAGGILHFSSGPFSFTNAISVVGPNSRLINTNAYNLSGPITGSGALAVSNTSVLSFSGSLAGYSGTISQGATGGNIRFNGATNANTCVGSAAATFDLGTTTGSISNFSGGNLTYDIGGLAGGANTIVAGRMSNTVIWPAGTTYSIGGNGTNSVFNGRILNGLDTVSVTKVGAGRLLLNGINAYTGPTTVSAGTLGGTGTIVSPVTVTANGTLAPGASIGTLTINNSLTLGGTTAIEVSRNAGVLTSDKVIGLTSVTYSGILNVTNVGPDALVQGDSFQVFNTGGSGNFTNITPALPAPLSWSFNPASGVLSVAGPSPVLNFTQVGNNLQFSWNNTTNIFHLQAQTNAISVGISSNWANYPGGGTSPVSVPMNVLNGTVFFRLVAP